MTVATRYLGTCPVCYREQKLRKGTMVQHGYTVPYGFFNGVCFGYGWAPFETSPDGTIAYVERVLQRTLDEQRAFVRGIEDGTIQKLYVKRLNMRAAYGVREYETIELTPADGHEFETESTRQHRQAANMIRHLIEDIAHRTQLVEQWEKKPVKTEQEVVQEREKMTSARRSAIDEARAAKQAKRAALDAKEAAREQEKLDLIAEYRQIFEELALDRSEQAKALARQHWAKMYKRMGKKGYLHFYPTELKSDGALFALGLAKPSGRGSYIDYAYQSGFL